MAENAIQKLNEQLKCAICLDTYTDPKLLQCFHIFCVKCLVKLVVRGKEGELTLPCPSCRNHTPIPESGVTGLQAAFRINELLEIRNDLKEAGNQPHEDAGPNLAKDNDDADGEIEYQSLSKKCVQYCSEHDQKEVELYCETCSELICYRCAVKGGKHSKHSFEQLAIAFEKYKKQAESFLKPMGRQLKTINAAMAKFDTHSEKITNQREFIEATVKNNSRRLHEIIDARTAELLDQLNLITEGKLKGLAIQKDQMEIVQSHVSRCMEFVEGSFVTGNQGDVLKMKATIVNQIRELIRPLLPEMSEPSSDADMKFSAPPEIAAMCQVFGKVYSPGSPDPDKCNLQELKKDVMVNSTSTATLSTINYSGDPCVSPFHSLECELVCELTKATVKCSAEKAGQSQYKITYQPTIKGRHQLHVKVEGQNIKESPFTVIVKAPVEDLAKPIFVIEGVKRPWGVVVNKKGEVIVAENGGNCISIFSSNGEMIQSFGRRGVEPGHFQNPRGVTVDGEGNILVADTGNCRIQKFTEGGRFVKFLAMEGSPPLPSTAPWGITYNAVNNRIYVVDEINRVQIFTADLSPLSKYGSEGIDNGQFLSPFDLACDSTGKVYVTDSGNGRVQVFWSDVSRLQMFTSEGKFIRMFSGVDKSGASLLTLPVSIAIDASDKIYVCHSNDCVSVFDSEAKCLASFGKFGDELGEFKYPHGIALSDVGVVYVSDRDNNRVQVF